MRMKALIPAGLVAGVWINVAGMFVVRFVLGAAYVERLMSHLPQPVGNGTLIRHLTLRFVLGLVAVALYATIRPRFDTPVRAAFTAGVFLLLAGYLPLAMMLNEIGVLVGWKLWATLAWSTGEAILAALLGGLVYDRLAG